MKKVFKIVGGIVAFTAMVAGIGAIVMLLWNWIVPTVIGWQAITC